MKIVMPMAGAGTRLSPVRAALPKPLVPVAGRPMFAWAWEGLRDVDCSLLVAVVLRADDERFAIAEAVRRRVRDVPVEVVTLDRPSDGQLSTVLAAAPLLDGEDALIASCDTYVRGPLAAAVHRACRRNLHGLLSVGRMPGDRWSFVRLNDDGEPVEVAEKRRISDLASTGIYWFSSGTEFLHHAHSHLRERDGAPGERYVMPLYQRYLDHGLPIGVTTADEVLDMGDPEALAVAAQALGARSTDPVSPSMRRQP